MNSPIITRTTPLSVAAVCERLPGCAAKHKFGVLGVHDLKEKLVSKGLSFAQECRVYEVCNPQQAHVILSGNMTVSAALPCRISIYTDGGQTVLATIEPEALLKLFGAGSAEHRKIASDVRASLVAILDEASAA